MTIGQLPRPKIAPIDAYDTFILERRARNVSPRTLSYYHDQLLPFIAWCEARAIACVTGIEARHVRQYVTELQRRGLSDWTVHDAARAIRAFLRFCVEEGIIAAAPKLTMPKLPKKVLPAFDIRDIKKLLKSAGRRDRSIVLFLLDTGLRADELMALAQVDIDMASGSVRVVAGKGGKGRTVYASAKTRRELQRYWTEHGKPAAALWVSERTGEPLTAYGLRKLLKRLGKKAGVAHCHPHTFRRTFALLALRGGMNIYVLQRLLGHASLDMVRKYLDLTEYDLEAAHKQAGIVDGLL